MTDPMTVEVSAWETDGDGIAICNHEPLRCDGFGVYIRNPLALHIHDIKRGPGGEGYSRAKREAFAYADMMAQHLGCEVVSALPRPAPVIAPAPAVTPTISDYDRTDAALCLWEAVIDLKGRGAGKDDQPIDIAFEAIGWASMRSTVAGWAAMVHDDWQQAVTLNDYDDPFDWEFCPDWIAANVTFDTSGATVKTPRTLPTGSGDPLRHLDPKLRPMLIDQMGLAPELVGGGAVILSHTFGTDWSVSVTCLDGGALPRPDSWQIGVYAPDNDGSPSWEYRSDMTGGLSLNMAQAIGVAWAIGTDA